MAEPIVGGIRPGLRVVVTAGGSGIGRRMVELFAAHGARVHTCDVDDAALAALADLQPQVSASRCDVAEPTQVDTLFAEAEAALGGLDVLVNNAGIAGPTKPVDQISIEEWDRTIAVDLNGMFYCTRLAVPMLRRAGDGAIVNLSSVAGRLGFPNRSPYAAAKWGVVGFTQSLARELGAAGIRVNAILPGPVQGPRIDRVIAARAQATNRSQDEVRQEMTEDISLGRFVTADDIASMALFLCSPAGRNISGQSLSVCGGAVNI